MITLAIIVVIIGINGTLAIHWGILWPKSYAYSTSTHGSMKKIFWQASVLKFVGIAESIVKLDFDGMVELWQTKKSKIERLMGQRITQKAVYLRVILIILRFTAMMLIYGSWWKDGEKQCETLMNILILNHSSSGFYDIIKPRINICQALAVFRRTLGFFIALNTV